MTQLKVCSVCGITGKDGANWVLRASGMPPRSVHRFCGEQALKAAPDGVEASLLPSRELQDKRRTERNVRSFWEEKFSQAKPLRKTPSSVPAE